MSKLRGSIVTSLNRRHPPILGPVSTMEAFEVGYDVGGAEAMRRLIRSFRLTELCNLLGLPRIALPVTIENGVPHGVQIIGRRFDEDRCFNAAETIEKTCHISVPIDPVIMTRGPWTTGLFAVAATDSATVLPT